MEDKENISPVKLMETRLDVAHDQLKDQPTTQINKYTIPLQSPVNTPGNDLDPHTPLMIKQKDLTYDTFSTKTEDSTADTFPLVKSSNFDPTDEPNPPPNQNSNLFNLSRKKALTLMYGTLGYFAMVCSIAIVSPLFPQEAKDKGIDTLWVSFAFSVLYLVIFMTAPFFGRYLVRIGPNFLFITCLYTGGITTCLLAFLHYETRTQLYLIIYMVIRCMFALSVAGFCTVAQATITCQFAEDGIGMALGVYQAGATFGFVFAPLTASFLYEAGGYPMPFYFCGGVIIIIGIAANITLPELGIDESENLLDQSNVWQLIQNPFIVITLLCTAIGNIGVTNIDLGLVYHLEPAHVTMTTTGLLFSLLDSCTSITNFILAYFTGKLHVEGISIISGFFAMAVGFLVLGPAPFLPFIPYSVTTICIALIVIGSANGITLVPMMKCLVIAATEMGYNESNLKVLSLLAGLSNSFTMLGGFLGQFGIGFIDDHFGFSMGFVAISLLNCFAFCLMVVLFTVRYIKKERIKSHQVEKSE